MRQAISDKTAIVGIGWTRFVKESGRSVLDLALDASRQAVSDAGLVPGDIDGVVTWGHENEWEKQTFPREVVAGLGLEVCNYQMFELLGGLQACSYVASAAMAVHAGLCKHVLVFRAMNGASDRGRPSVSARGPRQWTVPFGMVHAAFGFGLPVAAHMHRYGITNRDLGEIAVAQRAHALLNRKAMMTSSLTLEDHQRSPWIVYPYRLLDCCLNSDGACALVVSSVERARDLRHAPILIKSVMGGALGGAKRWETNAERAAPRLLAGADVEVSDIDFAELYDPFTGMCLLHIEGFGLAEPGTGIEWVRRGESGLDGRVPVNTHGGLLSEAYMQGLNHVVEAVQQLRPEGIRDDYCDGPHDFDRSHCRQIRAPEIGLVCGESGQSSLLLGQH